MSTTSKNLKMIVPEGSDNIDVRTQISDNLKILDKLGIDYIVEQKVNKDIGSWNYRKWSSGLAEVWGFFKAEHMPITVANWTIIPDYPFEMDRITITASACCFGDSNSGIRYVHTSSKRPDIWSYGGVQDREWRCYVNVKGRWRK